MRKFKLFNNTPPEKGISKKDERASVQTDFIGFFYMLGRKFWNLSNLNLLMSIYIVVIIGGFVLLSGIPYAPWVFLAFMLLFYGIFNVGATYVVRGYVRGDPVYIISDFKYGIKNNWKQGFVLGLIDILIIVVLIVDIFFWMGPIELPSFDAPQIVTEQTVVADNMIAVSGVETESESVVDNNPENRSFLVSVSFYGCLFLLVIYFMMRSYIYILSITFKLSVFKVLKNSFIFAFVGLKRNIMAIVGILFVCGINIAVLFSPLMMVGAVLPLIITVSLCFFISAYAAYPVIKKYMITPYYDDEEVNEAYDKIFVDRE